MSFFRRTASCEDDGLGTSRELFAVLDMASRSLEDLARSLDGAALVSYASTATPREASNLVRVAAAAQRYLSDEAPISPYSGNTRAQFWRKLVAGRPGVLAAACGMRPEERVVLFGSLVWLEKCSSSLSRSSTIDDVILPESRSCVLYALLSSPRGESEGLAELLRDLAKTSSRRQAFVSSASSILRLSDDLSAKEMPYAFRDWKRRELDAVEACSRAAAGVFSLESPGEDDGEDEASDHARDQLEADEPPSEPPFSPLPEKKKHERTHHRHHHRKRHHETVEEQKSYSLDLVSLLTAARESSPNPKKREARRGDTAGSDSAGDNLCTVACLGY